MKTYKKALTDLARLELKERDLKEALAEVQEQMIEARIEANLAHIANEINTKYAGVIEPLPTRRKK